MTPEKTSTPQPAGKPSDEAAPLPDAVLDHVAGGIAASVQKTGRPEGDNGTGSGAASP